VILLNGAYDVILLNGAYAYCKSTLSQHRETRLVKPGSSNLTSHVRAVLGVTLTARALADSNNKLVVTT